MKDALRPALLSLAAFTLLTGVAYPLALTGLARLLWPAKASGDASLIGQPFDHPAYFWGRLSATSPDPYTAFNAEKGTGSSGSNLGPLNPALRDAAETRAKALGDARPIPVDLLTASGSGLDPHISPAAARYQVARVAKARGLPEQAIRDLVERHSEPRPWGLLGEPAVHVLKLNRALDERGGKPR